MTFLIISHVPHIMAKGQYYAYAPYVREMNIWLKYVDRVIIVAPIESREKSDIDIAYHHPDIEFRSIPNFNITNIAQVLRTILVVPTVIWKVYRSMRDADHIHLRCPGNIGLIGVLLQKFFPLKHKTAKYAGNWDPQSSQPWSYNLQRKLLQNPAYSRMMTVLVYGHWPDSGPNIKSFFTASYSETEIKPISFLDERRINMVFAGTLSPGKRPSYAIDLMQKLRAQGFNVYLDIFGEGTERGKLEERISGVGLDSYIRLYGNKSLEDLTQAYRQAHFVVLPSASEGWPKAVAEGMFWGAIPLATNVSCLKYMLDEGNRGVILTMDIEFDTQQVEKLLNDRAVFERMRHAAATWSRQFTTEAFEAEIKTILQ